MRYFKLYFSYLGLAIKSRLSYKADTVLGIFSFIASNAANLLAVFLMLNLIPALNGYSFENLMFIYGMLLLPKGIDHIFTDAIWQIGFSYVVKGDIDKYMVKPLNVLFQIIAEYFQPEGFGEVILGTALVAIYLPMQAIYWTFDRALALIICIFFAIFVFMAIKLVSASVAFWVKRSSQVMVAMYEFSDYARYPIEIFNSFLRAILTFVIPFSLAVYLPISYLLNNKNIWIIVPQVAGVTIALCIVSYFVFWLGLKRYESAGS